MVKKVHTTIERDVIVHLPLDIKKQEFGDRVNRLIKAKGWTQSELSRRADLPRDSISSYVRGQSFPSPVSLKKLAAALHVSENELMPQYAESAISASHPMIEVRISPSAPNTAVLRINAIIPADIALKIQNMVLDATRSAARE